MGSRAEALITSQNHTLSYVLFGFYIVCLIFASIQVLRILYHRHNLQSFQFGFLVLCFFWTVLRVMLWPAKATWHPVAVTLLFWAPLNIQFATFSLLVLYYARVVHQTKWENKHRPVFFGVYFATNIILFIFLVAWMILDVQAHKNRNAHSTDMIHAIFSAVMFLILIAVLFVYSLLLRRKADVKWQVKSVFHMAAVSPNGMFWCTTLINVLFMSRCVIDIVAATDNAQPLRDGVVQVDRLAGVVCYFCWEIVPTLVVLLLFRKIPRTRRDIDVQGLPAAVYASLIDEPMTPSAVLSPRLSTKPAAVPLPGTPSVMDGHFFADEARYDSEDDAAGPAGGNARAGSSLAGRRARGQRRGTHTPQRAGVGAGGAPVGSVGDGAAPPTPGFGSLGPPPFMYSIPFQDGSRSNTPSGSLLSSSFVEPPALGVATHAQTGSTDSASPTTGASFTPPHSADSKPSA